MIAIGIEEHPDVDEADLFEEAGSHSDFTDSDPGAGPEEQFSEAVDTIRTRGVSFKNPEALYEFLFRYRDVLEYSSPVSGTLLHSIAKMTPEKYSDVAYLAKRLIQEHPQLLWKADGEGLTPVSMALVDAPQQLIRMILRTCSNDSNCRRALEEALQAPDLHGRTALHHLFRPPSRIKASLILKVLAFATDEALGAQDGGGCTPLHYLVGFDRVRPPAFKVVDYFLARDHATQESSRSLEYSSESTHTFLDSVDTHGLSVYQCLLSHTNRLLMAQPQRSPSIQKGQVRDSKIDENKPESTRPLTGRSSDQAADKSLVREDQQGLAGAVRPVVSESKARAYPKTLRVLGASGRIAKTLRLHYIRTRDVGRASRFLFGDNTEDFQLFFDWTGLPGEVPRPLIETAFAATRFCDVLKFVAFPSSVSVIQDTRLASNVSMTRAAGFGRRDMEFFSEFLWSKGVTHIINMQVYDFNPCHSDKSIEAVLKPFKIEELDWRKIDLDPRTIQEACNEVHDLTLWWSGNNTALRAWSEPTGLPALPYLKRVHICLPKEIQATDSMACMENNIVEFKKRLQNSLDSQTGSIDLTDHNAIDTSVEGNEEEASSSASTNETRSIQVHFSASRALSTGIGQPSSGTQDIAVPRRWLRCVHKFSRSFSEIWNKVRKMHGGWLYETDESVIVALIDDGVDILDPSIPPGAVKSGVSCEFVEAGHRPRPWYASHSGHGTMVASLITLVCPMARLYSMRVGPAEGNEDDVRSLAMALESAIAKGAMIIVLGDGTNVPHHNLPEMDQVIAVLHKAHERGVILLRPLPEPSKFSSVGDSSVWERFWGISPAQNERNHVPDSAPSGLVLPGTNAVISHLSENNSSDFASLLDVLGRVNEDEPSVATALAAGLISTLICCYKLIVSFKELTDDSSAREEAERSMNYVMQPAGMEAVLNNLGLGETEDGVVKVWQTLDSVSSMLDDDNKSVEEKIDQLEIMTRHLALGLLD